jgi:protein OS-9
MAEKQGMLVDDFIDAFLPIAASDLASESKRTKIGDIEVGGYRILPPGTKLERGAAVGGPEKILATLATSDGFIIDEAELAKKNIKLIHNLEDIRSEIARRAQGKEWRIDVVETMRGAELRAFIGTEKKEQDQREDASGEARPLDDGSEEEEGEYYEIYEEYQEGEELGDEGAGEEVYHEEL